MTDNSKKTGSKNGFKIFTFMNAEVVPRVAGSLEAVRIARISRSDISSNKRDDTLTKFDITLFHSECTVDGKSSNNKNVYIVGVNISTSVQVECWRASLS